MSLFSKATVQQVNALARCAAPDMVPLLSLLTEVQGNLVDRLAVADEPKELYRLQGELQAIQSFVAAINAAPSNLARFR